MSPGGKPLMVQGTASSVGKSILVAALCRIFRQDGLRVAPFKAQNMSLNAFVTPDGREIARVQAMQAEAAGVQPRVEMNPVLLKPEAEGRSQVVLMGKALGSFSARDYHYRLKDQVWEKVKASLQLLLQEFDVVVIEGAGSPAEVNLRDRDIANMEVAKAVNAPVLLVGDIDRGGVFASLVGTLELLPHQERKRVKGLIINKFRGDLSLLYPGLRFLEERTGLPLLGVIPYLRDLNLPEEDSVALEEVPRRPEKALLDIAVIQVPRISNFDDFGPLQRRPGICLRFVSSTRTLGHPDLIILPGTKTTLADLRYLWEQGLAQAILARVRSGTPILGVCGGFQMLGEYLEDTDGVETYPGKARGLGLLPVTTTFLKEKATYQVRAVVEAETGPLGLVKGLEISGYEIHMGVTRGEVRHPFRLLERSGHRVSLPEGALSPSGQVLGTYIHGLFRNLPLREAVLHWLARGKGLSLPPPEAEDDPYDRLAEAVRGSLDLRRLYHILGLP